MHLTAIGCARRGAILGFALAAALFPAPASAGFNSWSPLGEDTGRFTGFAADPLDPAVLYAVSGYTAIEPSQEVYRSTDGGQTWRWAHTGLGTSPVIVLETDPVRLSTLYAANQAGEFFRSTDRGTSWEYLSAPGDPREMPTRLTIVPRHPPQLPALFLSSHSWIRRSLDGGVTWRIVFQTSAGDLAGGVAADPAHPRRLFASNGRRILRSDDLGATWRLQPALPLLPGPDRQVRLAGVAPTSPSAVLAFARGAIYRSLDGGQTWRRTTLPRAEQIGTAFAVEGSRLWAGFTDPAVVMSSQDGGVRWRVMRETFNPEIRQIRVQPARREVYALGSVTGVERWASGRGWARLPSTGFLNVPTPTYSRGANPRVLYRDAEAFVSVDGGATFLPTAPTRPPGVNELGYHVETDPTRIAMRLTATGGGGVFRSLDSGVTWSLEGSLRPPPGSAPSPPQFPLPTPRLAFVGGETVLGYHACGLSRSTDAGATWTEVLPCILEAAPDPFYSVRRRVLEVVVSPLDPQTVFVRTQYDAALSQGGSPFFETLRSTDGGTTFEPVLFGRVALRFAPSDPSRVYLVQESGLWRSGNGGLTFTQVAPLGFLQGLNDLQVDTRDPQTVYAAVAGQGVQRSRDGGATWSDLSAGLAPYYRLEVSSLVVHPSSEATLYAYPRRGGTFWANFE